MSKRFSEQFKQEAVQLVSAERPIRQVASYLGIGYSTLDKWVRAHRERTGQLVALTQEQKRIRELERQLMEAKAQQIHNYHFASQDIEKLGITHCMASAVIATFTVLGGRTVGPVAIRDGLSEATIKALQEDMRRSFEQATAFKPKGWIGE